MQELLNVFKPSSKRVMELTADNTWRSSPISLSDAKTTLREEDGWKFSYISGHLPKTFLIGWKNFKGWTKHLQSIKHESYRNVFIFQINLHISHLFIPIEGF